jgi:SNF2 family DNA or RNA helicase
MSYLFVLIFKKVLYLYIYFYSGRREIPINALTVLKWADQKSATVSSSPQKPSLETSLSGDMSSPRVRRLIENQEHLTIQGRYGTKVDSIVSFILNLINDDVQKPTTTAPTTTTMDNLRPPLKILVFSQFTDVLNVLAISLKLNAISYLQFTSTKILQQFRQDPGITVLLMPLGKGFCFKKISFLFYYIHILYRS